MYYKQKNCGGKMNTEELTNKLKEYDNIDDFIQENENEFDENAFKNYLEALLQRKNSLSITGLANECGISVPYAHNLFKGSRTAPRKDKLLRLSFGLELNLDETNRLLTLGGTAELRSKVRRESIIIFCINKGLSLEETDELLLQYKLHTL
jgi:transcriptional regulator with XRE-family HTH domain